MKYFLYTEFLEGKQDEKREQFLNLILGCCFILFAIIAVIFIKYFELMLVIVPITSFVGIVHIIAGFSKKNTKPTIDLISIGIVSEDRREYYAISKDFNIREAWDRYQLNINKNYPNGSEYNKEYWIRDNVLKPIFEELVEKEKEASYKQKQIIHYGFKANETFTYKNFKQLIKKYGKTNEEIAKEVENFCKGYNYDTLHDTNNRSNPEFYTYYGAYDWVVFCWLFGKMIDLPKRFPMFSIDLKVMLDNKQQYFDRLYAIKSRRKSWSASSRWVLKDDKDYPKQVNEHNALDDAKWNLDLFNFINNV